MKTTKKLIPMLVLTATLGLAALTMSCQKEETSVAADKNLPAVEKYLELSGAELSARMNLFTPGVLDPGEITTLTYMREEELLARDIYLSFQGLYTLPVFKNIAKSELAHTTAIKNLLVTYNLPDPADNHQLGVFSNPDLQALYNTLLAQGSTSLNDALLVGATIEDLDIFDLETHIAQDVDNADILFVLNNLMKGSKNHLRAFNFQLTARGITYIPQYISQAEFDDITQ